MALLENEAAQLLKIVIEKVDPETINYAWNVMLNQEKWGWQVWKISKI